MKLKDQLIKMTAKTVTAELLVESMSAVGKLNRPAGGEYVACSQVACAIPQTCSPKLSARHSFRRIDTCWFS
jgi:hypothetical protein